MNIMGEVGSLGSLVEYQDGSIVSKEVIKREKGTVTLFAFDKGQGLSEHIAPFDALVYEIRAKLGEKLGDGSIFSGGRGLVSSCVESKK